MALDFVKEALEHIPDTLPKAKGKFCEKCKSPLYEWYQHISARDKNDNPIERECFYYCKKCKKSDWSDWGTCKWSK